jgi:hypothetical protein
MGIDGVEGEGHRTLIGDVWLDRSGVTSVLEDLEAADALEAGRKELLVGKTLALVYGVWSTEHASESLFLIVELTVNETGANSEA